MDAGVFRKREGQPVVGIVESMSQSRRAVFAPHGPAASGFPRSREPPVPAHRPENHCLPIAGSDVARRSTGDTPPESAISVMLVARVIPGDVPAVPCTLLETRRRPHGPAAHTLLGSSR